MTAQIRTVSGDIDPLELGPTYCHEHLLTQPAKHLVGPDDDLVLNDVERARVELQDFRDSGGRALVEVTTPEFGRDLDGLRTLSERSDVAVIAATGHVSEDYWRGVIDLDSLSEQDLVEEFVGDLTQGTAAGSRAGVIKVGSSLNEITLTETRVFKAAAAVQRDTGAPITTHTTAGSAAMEQVRLLEEAGVATDRVCLGHLDRRLVWDEHVALARTGVWLGYDCISKEQYQPDSLRAQFIVRLFEEGHGGQILLSGDLARRSYLSSWGGRPGYRYLIKDFTALLVNAGLTEADVDGLLRINPRRFLTWS
ncbi:MAG: phosphotriesterase family protein [Actinomycetota bacterium]